MSGYLQVCVESCLLLWEMSLEEGSGIIMEGAIGELGLGEEVGSFVLPFAICWAHFASRRDFDLEPGGLPTGNEISFMRKIDKTRTLR